MQKKTLTGAIQLITLGKNMDPKKTEIDSVSESLIASSLDGIFAFDRDLSYIAWNPAMEHLTSFSKEQVLGRKITAVFPHFETSGELAYYQKALAGKHGILTDWPFIIRSTGQQRFMETYFSPLRNEQKKIIGGLGVIRDITEYKAAKEAVQDFSQDLINSSVDGIFAFDKEFRYSAWNPTMEKITGLPRAEVIGKSAFDVFPDLEKSGEDSYFLAALAGNTVISEERQVINRRKDSSVFVEAYYAPLRSGSGKILGGLAIVRDITDYKKAKEALLKSENQFRSLIEEAMDVIATLSLDGRFTSLNPAWEKMTGWSIAQSLKMRLLDLVHPADKAAASAALDSLLSGDDHGRPVEYRIHKKNGQYRTIEAIARPLYSDGKLSELLIISRDITDRKQAEEDLRAWAHIFENVDIGIKISDPSGEQVQMVNPGYARMHGYNSPEELIRAPIASQYSKEAQPALAQHIQALKKYGYHNYESVHRRKDGSTFPVFIEATLVKDEKGRPLYRASIVRDITSRKALEEQVLQYTKGLEAKVAERTKELQERLREEMEDKAEDEALLGSIGEGVIATDENSRVVFINHQTEILLGKKMSQVLGKEVFSVFAVKDQNHHVLPPERRPVGMAMSEAKKINSSDYHYVRADGTDFPVALTTTPVILKDKIIGAITVFRDITKEKEVDRVKSEFVSLASHQLRTPLATINWYAETLLSGKVPAVNERQKRYLEQIYNASRRMSKLVHDLLNVSRIELGTFGIDPEPVRLPELVHDLVREMRLQIRDRKLRVVERYDPRLPRLMLDRQLVSIVFQNLITNAIKYNRIGGTITIEIALRPEQILCAVSDTGYGIPKDAQEQVFTKFFRADNVKGKDQDGTGLGLYIVRSLVTLLKGAIWFESPGRPFTASKKQRKKGTTFFVSIPVIKRKFFWKVKI